MRWNLVVSPETDTKLRQFLASIGGGRKGDLSKFVEEAVAARIFQLRVAAIKAANARVPQEELEAAVAEAIADVRMQRRKKRSAAASKV